MILFAIAAAAAAAAMLPIQIAADHSATQRRRTEFLCGGRKIAACVTDC
jgi:hypothetical protein